MKKASDLPGAGRCEAFDIVPTEDDADYVRCVNVGVREYGNDMLGRLSTRIACAFHRSLIDERPS